MYKGSIKVGKKYRLKHLEEIELIPYPNTAGMVPDIAKCCDGESDVTILRIESFDRGRGMEYRPYVKLPSGGSWYVDFRWLIVPNKIPKKTSRQQHQVYPKIGGGSRLKEITISAIAGILAGISWYIGFELSKLFYINQEIFF